MYETIASATFKICLDKLNHFLEHKYSLEQAQTIRKKIRTAIKKSLSTNPQIAPISNRLIDLGIKDYRQLRVDEHNLAFCRVDEKLKQVRLIAVMGARQSIQKLLSEVMLRL